MLLRLCIAFMAVFTIACIFLLIIIKKLNLRIIIGFMLLMHVGVCIYFGGNVLKYSTAYGLHEIEVNLRGAYWDLEDSINNHPENGVQAALDKWNNLVKQERNNISQWSLRDDLDYLLNDIRPIHIDDESIDMLERGELKLKNKELVYSDTTEQTNNVETDGCRVY